MWNRREVQVIRREAAWAGLRRHPEEFSARDGFLEWAPLCVLTSLALIFGPDLSPWLWMWMLAVAVFAGFKWQTSWRAIASGVETSQLRTLAYLFLWPGMDARRFLTGKAPIARPTAGAWVWALAKAIFGASLLWGLARCAGVGLLAGWIGMVGAIFLLHFGLFDGLCRYWRRRGIPARAFMRAPILARTLGDFWGRRWNPAFRDIVLTWCFSR